MNFKTTYALFGAFFLLLIVAAFIFFTGGKSGDEGLLLPTAQKLKPKDFDTLTITRTKPKEETIEFTRVDDKRWKLSKPVESRADGSAVERILEDVLSARKDGKGDPPTDLAKVGLEAPSATITLAHKDGTKFTVSLGSVSLGGANAQVYALSSDNPKSIIPLRRGSLSGLLKAEGNEPTAGELVKPLSEFRSKDLLLDGVGFNYGENVTSVRLAEGKNDVVLAKTADGGWKFEKPENYGTADAKGDAPGATGEGSGGVDGLLTAIAAIKPASTDDVIDAPADLGKIGLEKDKIAGPTITLMRKNSAGEPRPETLYVGTKDDASGKVYVRLDGETTVAKVPATLLEPVKKLLDRPAALRDRQLFAFAPIGCDAVDVKLPGEAQPLELRKLGTPPQWKLFDADGKEQPANTQTVMDLLSGLGGKPVKDFPDAAATDATLGFDRPAAELTFYVGGIIPEEKKEEKKDAPKDKDVKKDEPKEKAKDEPKEKAKEEAKEKAKTAEPKKEPPAKPKLKDPAARLIIGKRDKDLLYVRRILKDKDGKDAKTDFAISSSLSDKLTRGRIEYVDSTLPSFVTSTATKIDFSRGNEEFTVEKQEKPPGWVIRRPADRADRPADHAKIESILSELAHLAAVRLWSEKPGDRELERYGLRTPRLKATVTVKDGDKTQDKSYLFGAETDDKTGYYAKQGDRDLVFVVSKVALPSLEAGDIQDPVVLQLEATKLQSIKLTGWKDIVGANVIRDLERKGVSNWVLRNDDKIKLSVGQCEAFLNALTMVRAESFIVHKTGPKPEHKLDVAAGALEIAISLEGEKDPFVLTIGGVDPTGKNFFATCSKLPGDVFLLPKGAFEAVKAKPGYFASE